MENAVIYSRVSTDDQRNNYSLADQEDQLRKFCKRNGFEVIDHFQDDHSAKDFNRPEFQNFLQRLERKEIKCSVFVIYKMDRFSRNVTKTISMFERLKENGVRIISVMDGGIDFDDIKSFIPNLFQAATAQVDNMQRAENTTRGMMAGMKDGRWMWKAPYGYKNIKGEKRIEIDPEKAAIVKFCFTSFAEGIFSVEEVRKLANEKGLSRRYQSFLDILKNPFYAGYMKCREYRDEPEMMIKGIHDPIITEECFNQVQDILLGKKKKYKLEKLPNDLQLRHHIICPKCGKVMTGSRSKGNGGGYYYYHCQSNSGCKNRFRADNANDAFIDYLMSFQPAPEVVHLYKAILFDVFKTNEEGRELERGKLEKEIDKLSIRIKTLEDKYSDEEIDKLYFTKMTERYESEKNELILKHAACFSLDKEFKRHVSHSTTLLENLGSFYSTSSISTKQRIIGSIFPEKVVFEENSYRTTKINEVFRVIMNVSMNCKKTKAGKNSDFSSLVVPTGIEPVSKV